MSKEMEKALDDFYHSRSMFGVKNKYEMESCFEAGWNASAQYHIDKYDGVIKLVKEIVLHIRKAEADIQATKDFLESLGK